MSRYSISEVIRSAYSLALTKAYFPDARLVRRPIYLRGARNAEFGSGLTTGYNCRFDLGDGASRGITLKVGLNCHMGDNVHIVASENVTIGDNCLMASKVFVSDTTHGNYRGPNQSHPDSSPHDRPLHARPVTIGDTVWLGENVCVLPGVTIGDGAIVNANAVVTKDVPAATMVAGVPACVIKRWDEATGEWTSV
jgi:acetyltransferase-like isoleucine patch superfamily enzyme